MCHIKQFPMINDYFAVCARVFSAHHFEFCKDHMPGQTWGVGMAQWMRALALHQCGLGSVPSGLGLLWLLSLLLGRDFSLGTPVFPTAKNNLHFPNPNLIWRV